MKNVEHGNSVNVEEMIWMKRNEEEKTGHTATNTSVCGGEGG